MTSPTSLVLCPGHGVCKAGFVSPELVSLDTSWIGIFPGEGSMYVEHIRAAVEVAAARDAVLVFSGGQTRADAGRRSEAESYHEIATAAEWWGHSTVTQNALKEEFARDSFENLLFSIAAFHRDRGDWPLSIAIVGWRFKTQRYDLHREALHWPKARYEYFGVNDPDGNALAKAQQGERAKLEATRRDPYLLGDEWISQRTQRDPFARGHPYAAVHPSLANFFSAPSDRCEFPWEQSRSDDGLTSR